MLAACPPTGSRFRHYKGAVYEVVGCCLLEATRAPCVLYRPAGSDLTWCRPLADWQQEVEVGGDRVPRFQRIL
ncbi:hypothetical protein AYO44_06455 [Planctomycetaceae bacterium SCGC AG-212-F19]|nr:hypothetical protein AYO44_06455 [Planctomycetaceae bacterium SCGC AG-212-F19]